MPVLHRAEDTIAYGATPETAKAAMILVHGRGATPESILPLADAFGRDDILYLAPRASGSVWYPNSFLAPIEANEPWLTSALDVLGRLVAHLGTLGLAPERVVLAGFSQGACLSSEFVARNARRYGGLAVLSGGLIGPPGISRAYAGTLDGTPAFLGCSDIDPHIPLTRVNETRDVLSAMGATVDERIYPGFGHSVNEDEIAHVRDMLAGVNAMA